MDLRCPPYTGLAAHRGGPLRFVWDDTRASKDFRGRSEWVLEAAARCSTRAQMVLCVGLYEWVMWRFADLHDDPAPMQVAEAAWLSTIDPRFIDFFELTREDWRGPIRGPLWCAITWLRPAVAEGDDKPEEIDDALQYLTRLALHVLPDPAQLESWLRTVLPRLEALYPYARDDPFQDLFAEEVARRRGPLVGRDVLDPRIAYTPAMAADWSVALQKQADPSRNPFLAVAPSTS